MMRFKLGLSCAALLSASLALSACGSNDDAPADGGNGAGGERSIDSQTDELEKLIAELQDQIESGEGNQEDLKKKLEDAEKRLEDLETCNNGGSCESLGETTATLTSLADAYCEWLFSCCDANEVRASVAPHMATVEDCQETYGGMITRGNAQFEFYHEGAAYGLGYDLSNLLEQASMLADGVERGRLSVNEDKLAACVDFITSQQCADDDVEAATCGSSIPRACEEIYVGNQKSGEECDYYYDECEEGYVCGYGAGYSQGICVPEAQEDDTCVEDSHCNNGDQTLYCDEASGHCLARPGVGESCAFLDPNFEFSGYSLTVPCQLGLECSPETSKCVEPCAEESYCHVNGNDCDEGLKCQVTPYAETELPTNYGHCGEPGTKGQPRNNERECESGIRYYDAPDYLCAGIGGESCSLDIECASGSCDTTCATYCGGDFEDACGADEYCSGNACMPIEANGEPCSSDDGCESGICHAGLCSAQVATGGDCDADADLCPESDSCRYTGTTTSGYQCVTRVEIDADCSAATCVPGAFCDGESNTCQPLYKRPNGVSCGSWQQCASERCDYTTGLCVDGTKQEGDACSVAHPGSPTTVSFEPRWSECEKGLFCKRTTPNDADDLSGTCTAQLPEGALCDRSLNSDAPQCAGNETCTRTSNTHNQYVCPVLYDEEDEAASCTLSSVPSVLMPWYYGSEGPKFAL